MCALRDAAPKFEQQGVRVFGISRDDVRSQAEFKQAQKLAFPLLSDPDGSVAGKYGAGMEGRPMARRVTFLVDEKGVVRKILHEVDVADHGEQVLAEVAKLRG